MTDSADTTSHAPATAPASTTPSPHASALVTGDRICAQCGYNLVGQPITREPHYQLLIARCPECGQVAALQEYPLLGRWAGRMGAMLAALWLLLLIALWFATSLMIFGMSYGVGVEGSYDYARWLRSKHEGPPDFNTWWNAQDPAALLAEAYSELGAIGMFGDLSLMLVSLIAMCFIAGVIWSVALIARGFGGLIAWAFIMTLLAAAIIALPLTALASYDPAWSHTAAEQQLVPPLALFTIICSFICLLLGMLAGRPIARWLTKILLPPAMWCRMHWLWTMRGLTPPSPPTSRVPPAAHRA